MAKGKKTGGKNIEKGQCLNPKGRPRGISAARKLNGVLFATKIAEFFRLSVLEIESKFKDPKTEAVDMVILKVLFEAIKKGDQQRLNFLLERSIGKVPDHIDLTSSDGSMSPQPAVKIDLSKLSDKELAALHKLYEKIET